MQDIVQLTRNMHKLRNIVVVKFEMLVTEQVLNIAQAAGQQIVHAHHMVSFPDKTVGEMRAQKSCSSCYQYSFQSAGACW